MFNIDIKCQNINHTDFNRLNIITGVNIWIFFWLIKKNLYVEILHSGIPTDTCRKKAKQKLYHHYTNMSPQTMLSFGFVNYYNNYMVEFVASADEGQSVIEK